MLTNTIFRVLRLFVGAVLLAMCPLAIAQAPEGLPQRQADDAKLEADFKEGIRLEFPADRLLEMSKFVLAYPETGVPLLLQATKERLGDDPESRVLVQQATGLIAYAASTSSIDALAELITTDEARFFGLVDRTLNHAVSREREFEVAAYAVERHASLRKHVAKWLDTNLAMPLSEESLARSIVRHEAAGDRNPADSLLPLITERQREHLRATLERVRTVERERAKQRK